MDLDIRISFIVLQTNVVLGTMFLDQVPLEDERLELGPDQDPFDMGNLAHQAARLLIMAGIRMEIRADAIFQTDGFADIDDRPFGVLHQVTAGFGGQRVENALDVFGCFHGNNFTASSKNRSKA